MDQIPTDSTSRPWLASFLRIFFQWLYHPFAWMYDAVAAIVSFGEWQRWVQSVLPYIKGNHILELGHGPGHLAARIAQNHNVFYTGLDESAQMSKLARRNNSKSPHASQVAWVRGMAERPPFAPQQFDTIVATFPTEYIFQPATLENCARMLKPDGSMVVLLAVDFERTSLRGIILKWIYTFLGQAKPSPQVLEKIHQRFYSAGLVADLEWVKAEPCTFLMLKAKRTPK
ncbi:MAG: class I SAM-dependent methyltransferase [Chloroflexi bacterium]|nr:class I SAM-dependent methyltransferase [Chloroflexota bacterium]